MKKSSIVAYSGLFALIAGTAFWISETRAQAQQPVAAPTQGRGVIGRGGGGSGGGGRAQQDPFAGADLSPKPPVLPLSPAEEATHFLLPSGYKMTPVLTDPDIYEPMQISFDGNGRMFVLEMRSYGRNADFTNEDDPVSRISLHEDTKGTAFTTNTPCLSIIWCCRALSRHLAPTAFS